MNKKIGFYGGKMLPVHCGHIFSILYSASLCDELHVFLFYNTINEKELINNSKFSHNLLQKDVRELILKYEFCNFDNIKIHSIDCEKNFNVSNEKPWDYCSSIVNDTANCFPDIVFSSEPEQEKFLKKSYSNVEFHLIDENRETIGITSSEIRNGNDLKYWDYLPKSYQSICAKSIVIFGENRLKNHLVEYLCKIFKTSFVDNNSKNEEEMKKNILNARYNANKVFFIKSVDENFDKYVEFYKNQDYRFSLNCNADEIKKYNSINFYGSFNDIFKQIASRIENLLKNSD